MSRPMEISEEQKKLVDRISLCNKNIEHFVNKYNDNWCGEIFNTKKVEIEQALDWLELVLKRLEPNERNVDSDLSMAIFWHNVRKTVMGRLVALNEAEAA